LTGLHIALETKGANLGVHKAGRLTQLKVLLLQASRRPKDAPNELDLDDFGYISQCVLLEALSVQGPYVDDVKKLLSLTNLKQLGLYGDFSEKNR
jgi:hypothetical protein